MSEYDKDAEEKSQDTAKVNGVPVQDEPQSSNPETPANTASQEEKEDIDSASSTDDVTYDVPPADL